MLLFDNGTNMVLLFLVLIICLYIVTKSTFLVFVLVNNFLLLHK